MGRPWWTMCMGWRGLTMWSKHPHCAQLVFIKLLPFKKNIITRRAWRGGGSIVRRCGLHVVCFVCTQANASAAKRAPRPVRPVPRQMASYGPVHIRTNTWSSLQTVQAAKKEGLSEEKPARRSVHLRARTCTNPVGFEGTPLRLELTGPAGYAICKSATSHNDVQTTSVKGSERGGDAPVSQRPPSFTETRDGLTPFIGFHEEVGTVLSYRTGARNIGMDFGCGRDLCFFSTWHTSSATVPSAENWMRDAAFDGSWCWSTSGDCPTTLYSPLHHLCPVPSTKTSVVSRDHT